MDLTLAKAKLKAAFCRLQPPLEEQLKPSKVRQQLFVPVVGVEAPPPQQLSRSRATGASRSRLLLVSLAFAFFIFK